MNVRAEHIDQQPATYRRRVYRAFRQNKLALWSLRILYFFLFIAVFSDFLANDKPLYCQLEGKTYFPVLKSYGVDLGIDRWPGDLGIANWYKLEYDNDRVVWPLIPYAAKTIDLKNNQYRSPFGPQRVESMRFWHWMGTDEIGHDIAAGMISGTRTAMLVGVVAMSIATLIGIFFGALAGFWGDDRLRVSRLRLILNILAFPIVVFYGFIARSYAFAEGHLGWELLKSIVLIVLVYGLVNLVSKWLESRKVVRKNIVVPLDLWIMRFIEIVNSVPTLLLLLSVVSILSGESIFYIMVIIGLIRWTGIARFIRAELLKVKRLQYIEAAQALGMSQLRILWRHAIPNALTPVLITISFGIAGAILLEAFFSFLGIGIGSEVTWGSILSTARRYPAAWWLALLPGSAIFITVTIFNLIGDGLSEAMNPKGK